MENFSYKSVSVVIETFELARQRFGSGEKVGTNILLHLFKVDPTTKKVFGFELDDDVEGDSRLQARLLVAGAGMIQMVGGVFHLLGPDADMMDDVLVDLGRRHKRLGVKKEYFAVFGEALFKTLSDLLQSHYTTAVDKAWREVFGGLSAGIIRSL